MVDGEPPSDESEADRKAREEAEEEEIAWQMAAIELLQELSESGVTVTVYVDAEDEEYQKLLGLFANGVKQLKRIADIGEKIFEKIYNKAGSPAKPTTEES